MELLQLNHMTVQKGWLGGGLQGWRGVGRGNAAFEELQSPPGSSGNCSPTMTGIGGRTLLQLTPSLLEAFSKQVPELLVKGKYTSVAINK